MLEINQKITFRELDIITSKMQREFGQIRKGSENDYMALLLPMESNLLRTSRSISCTNGRRAAEAVQICLLKVKERLDQTMYDYSSIITNESASFTQALLMSFDPFANPAIHNIIKKNYDLSSKDGARTYYATPIKCLLKIKSSIDFWTKEYGASGYFDFIDGQFGFQVRNNAHMDYGFIDY